MNPSVRAWLLLLVTLLLGIVLGVLGGGALQERRLSRLDGIRRPGGLTEHLREVIRPVNDSQWNAIRPVIEATVQRNDALRRTQDASMRAAFDSLKATLMPMLDAGQRERLSRFAPRRPGPPGGRRGPPGRPDGEGPPDREGGPPGRGGRDRGPPPPPE